MLRSAAQSHQTVDGDSEQSKVPPAVGRVSLGGNNEQG